MRLTTAEEEALSMIADWQLNTKHHGLPIRAQSDAGAPATLKALEKDGLIALARPKGKMPRWTLTAKGKRLVA